ncbi:hypothetical protein PsorP6_014498 [Peronosclerospora sorghi]|uniref:Uncharacterized protein n=1 Tax=Peronosclerospora sorghi TaxID=230839 RepID=A0ACC0VS31_9STRA|nr:hypothetical protein PsorP6_014498 [Peronosclerospora sorghi]
MSTNLSLPPTLTVGALFDSSNAALQPRALTSLKTPIRPRASKKYKCRKCSVAVCASSTRGNSKLTSLLP